MGALTQKQLDFARAVAGGTTLAKAAQLLGLADTTASRWHRLDGVREKVRELQVERVQGLAGTAIGVVEGLMSDPNTPHAVRLKAALEVLDRAGFSGDQAPTASAFSLHIDLSADSVGIKSQSSTSKGEERQIIEHDPESLDS